MIGGQTVIADFRDWFNQAASWEGYELPLLNGEGRRPPGAGISAPKAGPDEIISSDI